MAIEVPTYNELVNRIRADLISYLPDVDPTIYGSFIRALVDSLAGRSYDHIQLFKQLEKNIFPQTADGDFLENRWANYENISRNSATTAVGKINIPGDEGTTVPVLTEFSSFDGNVYALQQAIVLSSNEESITSLEETDPKKIVATTLNPHGYGTGITVTIAGADQGEYNGDFVISVSSETKFYYYLDSSPSVSPATGTITSTFEGGFGTVESEDYGSQVNIENGSQLTLQHAIAGVETTSYTSFTGIGGAVDIETDANLLKRVLQSRAEPVANFNVARITKTALSIPGVTRVWVKRIYPEIGSVSIYFLRDNDVNKIPNLDQINEVRDAILEYLPATSDPQNVYVEAPDPVYVDFTFTALNPNTPSMQDAIRNNLEAFFEDEVEFETDILRSKYEGAISNTIDLITQELLLTFTLSEPTGDIVVGATKIGFLGEVNFTIT